MEQTEQPPTLLSTHPSCRTTSVDEAEESVSRYLNSHRLVPTDNDFSLIHNVVDVGNVKVHYIDYGGAVQVQPVPQSGAFYLVQVPLAGEMSIAMPRQNLLSISRGGAVASMVGLADSPMTYQARCPRLLVQVPANTLRQGQARVAPGLAEAALAPLTHIDVSAGAGFSWLKLLLWMLTDIDSSDGMLARTSGAHYLEQLIVDGLVLAQSDYAEAPTPPSKTISSAIDYMRAHLHEPITPADVAGAVHVSVRALQEGFRKHLGTTPMTHLRDLRLDAVHAELLTVAPGQSNVSEIAHQWGVTHMGRFARDYRERFGVAPSVTLRTPYSNVA